MNFKPHMLILASLGTLFVSCGKNVGKPEETALFSPVKSASPSTSTATVSEDPTLNGTTGSAGSEVYSALSLKIQEVMNMESVWPGYPTWNGLNVKKLPAKRGAQPGVFWPQRLVAYVARGLGYNVDLILYEKDGLPSLDWSAPSDLANMLLKLSGDTSVDVTEVSDYYAQSYANEGKVVVAVGWTSRQDQKVRLGIVAPNKDFYDNDKGAYIASSAPEVKLYTHKEWVKVCEDTPRYFLLPKKQTIKLGYSSTGASALASKIDEIQARDIYKTEYKDPNKTVVLGITLHAEGKEGNTWAGYSTFEIVKAMGLEPMALTGINGIAYVSLADMLNILVEMSKANSKAVEEVDDQKAQSLANIGDVVVVVADPTPSYARGHMAVVYPDSRAYDSKLGPLLSQVGSAGKVSALKWRLGLGLKARYFHIMLKNTRK